MTERSMVWTNSTGDGGPYNQDRLDDFLAALAGYPSANEGVIRGYLNELEVSNPSGTTLRVATGAALVDGKLYENDANVDLTATTPSVGTTGMRVVLRKDWSAQTVRAVIISSADGTSSLPALTQTDGTTWEIPLASFEVTTGGVVQNLTDEREMLTLAGDWETIEVVELASASSQIQFSGIESRFRLFRLWVQGGPATDGEQLYLRLNNDSGANYDRQELLANSTSLTGSRTQGDTSLRLSNTNADGAKLGLYTVEIAKVSASVGGVVTIHGSFPGQLSGNQPLLSQGAGLWNNTVDLIESIEIFASSGDIASGTVAVLEGRAL